MPRHKRQKSKNKNKNKKNKNKNVQNSKNTKNADIESEVNKIRMMIAENTQNSNELAMKRINLWDESSPLPLILKSFKCLILAHFEQYDALKLVLHEIANDCNNKWDTESLNCLTKACNESGETRYWMIFLDSAFYDASNAIPRTEDKWRDLYVAYFINSEYDKLSSFAQKMKRSFKHNGDEYALWSIIGALIGVISNHFDCVCFKDKEKDIVSLSSELSAKEDTILKLQQYQFERQFTHNMDAHAPIPIPIAIYYRILKLRKKWKELLAFIDGEMCNAFMDKKKLKLWKLECLLHLDEWHQIDTLCAESLFKHHSEDWEIWTNWIDAQFVIHRHNALSMATNMESMKRMQLQQPHTIAPFLAEIELNLKAMQFNDAFDADILIALIVRYFKRFSSRNNACFNELKKYLSYIKLETAQKKLLRTMKREAKEEGEEHCYHEIELYFGVWMKESEHELRERVQYLLHKHEYIIAVQILLHLAHTYRRTYMVDAIVSLELAQLQLNNNNNFEMKLYLVRMYCNPWIGNITAAFKQFESMKIRGIQYDSLSHMLYHDAARYGFITVTSRLHEEMLQHRREFANSNVERMPQCFKYKQCHKVIEFAEFNCAMKQSEMFVVSQSHYVWNKLLQYPQQQHLFPDIIDYFETFIVPNHPRLYKEKKEEKDDGDAYDAKWTAIDLNDYSIIPMHIAQEKQNDLHKLIKCSPVATLAKQCHTQLLLLSMALLYKALSNDHLTMNTQLIQLWQLFKSLQFVHCDCDCDCDLDISQALRSCDVDNYHWILLFCFLSLHALLFTKDGNDRFVHNLAFVCDKMVTFTDDLSTTIDAEVNKASKYQLKGIHLQKIWSFISTLCFPALTLFKYWMAQTKSNQILNKIIMDQYQCIAKKTDKLKRTLSGILTNIESQLKSIALVQNTANEKQLDKILKQYDANELEQHKSSFNFDGDIKNKTKLRDRKIAMININNNMIQNSTEILKQNILILRHLRLTF